MTLPRAVSSDSDQLAATISGLKSRLNELESASGLGIPPIGAIVDYLGEVAPAGWAILDGATLTNGRFLYPVLWTALPNSFKSGNNILLPDTRGRVAVHQATSGLAAQTIGALGGANTVALTTSELPSHAHDMQHVHLVASRSFNVSSGAGGTTLSVNGTAANTYSGNTLNSSTFASEPDTGNTGSGVAHNNMQEFIVVVKIMKLG